MELLKSIDGVHFTGKYEELECSKELLCRGSALVLMDRLLDGGTEDLNLR